MRDASSMLLHVPQVVCLFVLSTGLSWVVLECTKECRLISDMQLDLPMTRGVQEYEFSKEEWYWLNLGTIGEMDRKRK